MFKSQTQKGWDNGYPTVKAANCNLGRQDVFVFRPRLRPVLKYFFVFGINHGRKEEVFGRRSLRHRPKFLINFLNYFSLIAICRLIFNLKKVIFVKQFGLGFGRKQQRKIFLALSFSAVTPKPKKVTKLFQQTKNDRSFVQA